MESLSAAAAAAAAEQQQQQQQQQEEEQQCDQLSSKVLVPSHTSPIAPAAPAAPAAAPVITATASPGMASAATPTFGFVGTTFVNRTPPHVSQPVLKQNACLFMDRGGSLREGADKELPALNQSDCTAHVWGNVKKQAGYKKLKQTEKKELKKAFYEASNALMTSACDVALATIKSISSDIFAYLTTANTSKERWCTAYAKGSRLGRTSSQASESLNKAVKSQRKFLPPAMMSGVYHWVTNTFATRKKEADDYVSKHGRAKLTPNVQKMHDNALKRAVARRATRPSAIRSTNASTLTGKIESWTVVKQDGSRHVYDVQISNVQQHSCCGYRVETGMPCWHQILLAEECGIDPNTLYDPGFRAGAWQDQYQFAMAPADVVKLPALTAQAPQARSFAHTHVPVPPGRPKSSSRKAGVLDDVSTSGRAPCKKCESWAHATKNCFQCQRCLVWGHKAPTCRSQLPPAFSYIVQTKRKRHGDVLPWDANKRSGCIGGRT